MYIQNCAKSLLLKIEYKKNVLKNLKVNIMRNSAKYILITLTLMTAATLGIIFTQGNFSTNIEDIEVDNKQTHEITLSSEEGSGSAPEGSGVDNETMPYTYEEWRLSILEYYNMTLEDVDGLDNRSLYFLDSQARIYAGWANGTYTEEELDQLLDDLHSSPVIENLEISVSSELAFHAEFDVFNAPLTGEHVFRVYSYIDYNIYDTNIYGGNLFYDGDDMKGPYGWYSVFDIHGYAYTTLPYEPYHNPAINFMGPDIWALGIHQQQPNPWHRYVFDIVHQRPPGPIYFVIQVLYRYDHVPFPWLEYTCKFKWVTVIVPATIFDDDPYIPVRTDLLNPKATYIWEEDNLIVNPSFIYDDEDCFIIGADFFELSGFKDVIVKIDGNTISKTETINGIEYPKYGWTVEHVWDGIFRIYTYLFFPGYYYGLGNHIASITVIDDDHDRIDDSLASFPFYTNFEIKDDDITGPSIIEFTHEEAIFDSDPGLTVKVKAVDDSGINNYMTYVYDLETNEGINYPTYVEDGYYCVDIPNPLEIKSYTRGLIVWDADSDRPEDFAGKFEYLSFRVVDDDEAAPTIHDLVIEEQTLNPDSTISLKFTVTASDYSGFADIVITIGEHTFTSFGTYTAILSPGKYTLSVNVRDDDSDRESDSLSSSRTFDLIVDLEHPETILSIDPFYEDNEGITYVSPQSGFTLSAEDDVTESPTSFYIIDGGLEITYSEIFTLDGYSEGLHTIEYYSIDETDNVEPLKSEEFILDYSPPETTIEISFFYDDGLGNIYVTSATDFTLLADDALSGVDYTMYKIDNGLWIEYISAFNLPNIEGSHTIYFYSVDNVGNSEGENQLSVILVRLEIDSYITAEDTGTIENFDVIFRKCKQDGVDGFMLVATNPGQIFYNIEIFNNWPVALNTLVIDATLPDDFVTKGAVPTHIFLDGVEITDLCVIEGNLITITDLAPGSMISIVIHVDYGLKDTFYETLDDFGMKNYEFLTEVQCNSDSLSGTYSSSTNFNVYQKKVTAIAGFVMDELGNPITDAIVELILEDGTVLTVLTDSEGFYFFINLPVGIHQIRVFDLTGWQVIETWKAEVSWMDFIIP